MSDFRSKKVSIEAPCEAVFAKLSNLENLRSLAPLAESKGIEIKNITSDSCSLGVPKVGDIALFVEKRVPHSLIRLVGQTVLTSSLSIEIQLSSEEVSSTGMVLLLDADIPFFARMMVEKPLKDGLDKVAEMLTKVQYT